MCSLRHTDSLAKSTNLAIRKFVLCIIYVKITRKIFNIVSTSIAKKISCHAIDVLAAMLLSFLIIEGLTCKVDILPALRAMSMRTSRISIQ